LPVAGPIIRGTIQAPIGLATGDDPWSKFALDCWDEGSDCTLHPQVQWRDGSHKWLPMSRLDPTRQGYADAVMAQSFMTLIGSAPFVGAPPAPVWTRPSAAPKAPATPVTDPPAAAPPADPAPAPRIAGFLPERIPPRGFANEAQFSEAVAELKVIAERFGDANVRVRVRGSSTTGLSQNPHKSGKWFGPTSDIDVALESERISDALRAAGQQPSKNVPGLFLPEKIKASFPEFYGDLMRWNRCGRSRSLMEMGTASLLSIAA
jgi:hypothetical protein